MALIKCKECGKEISDKAVSCPNCGCPISEKETDEPSVDFYMCCPVCGSRDLHVDKKGFSGGKALVGALTVGEIGTLAGTIGSNDIRITCLCCGKKFAPGEAGQSHEVKNEDKLLSTVKQLLLRANGNQDYYKEAKKLYLLQGDKKEADFERFAVEFDEEIKASPELQELQAEYARSEASKKNGGCFMIITGFVFLSAIASAYFW